MEKIVPIFARACCRSKLSVSVANRDFVPIAYKMMAKMGEWIDKVWGKKSP
ncbi:MAG: hypothetical protein AB7U26_01990 [Sulfuricurvum sp.]|uniref:hypothetical protein n=1 Tax=Sulfuricurvum sp. IAE1 TaxID=2546102 RepID=UPI00140469AC|nr:hypothetical protein [Sulfuricurvum sp. IAE1]MDD3770150.1 hypothetical protein [Sulfuricurvum sp.]